VTIGIGALGPNAGLAVFEGLRAAERVANGSIGGFAVFAAVGPEGKLWLAETQRGGTATLFTEGEKTGVPPPPHVAAAMCAAVMSSGPDRPDPLSQFIAADPLVGLVTGHRLPSTIGNSGNAVNQAVLALMAAGANAEVALAEVLDDHPDVDAGMIALGPDRGIAARNSALVSQRPDLGAARCETPQGAVEVLHNAITPRESLALLVAEIAADVMTAGAQPLGQIVVKAGTPVRLADCHRVIVDERFEAVQIDTRDPQLATGTHNCAAVYLGAAVVRNGEVIGTTTVEPNVVIEDGVVKRLSGQSAFRIPFNTVRR
jgi:Domain of unknown function (DUF6963)